jgi:hypothetical protein
VVEVSNAKPGAAHMQRAMIVAVAFRTTESLKVLKTLNQTEAARVSIHPAAWQHPKSQIANPKSKI